MTISSRLIAMLGVSALGLVGLAICAMVSLAKLDQNIRDLADNTIPSDNTIADIESTIDKARLLSTQRLYWEGPHAEQDANLSQLRSKVTTLFKKYNDELVSDDKDRALLNQNLL